MSWRKKGTSLPSIGKLKRSSRRSRAWATEMEMYADLRKVWPGVEPRARKCCSVLFSTFQHTPTKRESPLLLRPHYLIRTCSLSTSPRRGGFFWIPCCRLCSEARRWKQFCDSASSCDGCRSSAGRQDMMCSGQYSEEDWVSEPQGP